MMSVLEATVEPAGITYVHFTSSTAVGSNLVMWDIRQKKQRVTEFARSDIYILIV
jgi:hypothetical protein